MLAFQTRIEDIMEIQIEELTPMMRQYLEVKKDYKDCILFYRIGDFYEMFYEDALTASKELEITLTGKACGTKERAPMCGVPFHAALPYINKLVGAGYKVAVCEQVEDPKTTKGIVKREVIRIVTPGTNLDLTILPERKNNYLMGIVAVDEEFGVATVDVSTGEFLITEIDGGKNLLDEISKFGPSEIICNENFILSSILSEDDLERNRISLTKLEKRYYDKENALSVVKKHFGVEGIQGLGLDAMEPGILSTGMVLQYLYDTQKNSLSNIISLKLYKNSNFMMLDSSTRRNLELTETMRDKSKRGSLLWVLDKTKTAMGGRLLRSFMEQPLIDRESINERLHAIEEFNEAVITREEIREYLSSVYDIERLLTKICYKTANPRDVQTFGASLSLLPAIKLLLSDFEATLLQSVRSDFDTLDDVFSLIERAICDEPPISVRDGRIIREGFHEEVDSLRKISKDGKSLVGILENKERERTGIKNLKIKYNKVFGYYFEVTNSYKDKVPEDWTRKQTLANAERYINPELKEFENKILGAEEKLVNLEYQLFMDVIECIGKEIGRIAKTASCIANIDVFSALSVVAQSGNYVKPSINEEGIIDIKGGRHPVVEKMLKAEGFIINDTYLDDENHRISIITGPNMAGKSTYMRQVAIIVLMAQIGSFVPASEANIGICDRIFTRVGASDDLASGQSTFMVEMSEVANILRNATKKSLLILDEIGRGTSTYDGLSIAWAVVEYISNPKLLGAKTLFATHYHELTELEGKLPDVNNYCIAVREDGDDIVFLRKIVKGGADKSYGIHVAKLAGVPQVVLDRAMEISDSFFTSEKEGGRTEKKPKNEKGFNENQLSFSDCFKNEDIIKELIELDFNELSIKTASDILYELQLRAKARA